MDEAVVDVEAVVAGAVEAVVVEAVVVGVVEAVVVEVMIVVEAVVEVWGTRTLRRM